jgi:RNA polymerase sigma factor (TIGR02999 family)
MAQERAGHTLQATALVHEAYLRLVGGGEPQWSGRAHFYTAAAEAMRRILIEHARARGRMKRGGDSHGSPARRVPLCVVDLAAELDSDAILSLDEAVRRLEMQDTELAWVVRLRFYAGLDVETTAAALGLSPATVKRRWAFARALLFQELGDQEGAERDAGES